jgi:hypothetical protein
MSYLSVGEDDRADPPFRRSLRARETRTMPRDTYGDSLRLSTLTGQALGAPGTVDLAELQAAADAFLAEAHGGNKDLLAAVRYLAGAAFALGTFGSTAEALEDLRTAARLASMTLKLHQLHQH